MKVLFVGFGNVARKVAEIVTDDGWPSGRGSFPLEVSGIFTGSRGCLAGPVDLAQALAELNRSGHFDENHRHRTIMTPLEACQSLDYDVLVELSPLSIEGRGEPALSHARAALDRGRHVVTANKGPVAFAHRELARLAEERGVRFLFESSVMDGAPLFNMARASLRGCRVEAFAGILNGTTNAILCHMEQGGSLEEGIAAAQAAGIAEADPSHDVDGWDGAAKTAALANVLMGADVTPLDVDRQGIRSVTIAEARSALASGRRLKLVCRGSRLGEKILTSVAVEALAVDDPFALVDAYGAILRIETDLMHPIVLTQEGPELIDTAYGVLNDLMEIAGDEKARRREGR